MQRHRSKFQSPTRRISRVESCRSSELPVFPIKCPHGRQPPDLVVTCLWDLDQKLLSVGTHSDHWAEADSSDTLSENFPAFKRGRAKDFGVQVPSVESHMQLFSVYGAITTTRRDKSAPLPPH